ncbi:CgeB family protein [Bordetella petrii]|uniref:CgeB family protein n=1 Tax=Bordetella petrii TaxID=94624 RepID=UPI001E3838B1|nr:glycosyltransferase [Bordetella petrii]MCD0501725.1 glycosyltransferase [Bordetella petrii]
MNYRWVLSIWRPDLLFVESAWKGKRNSWRYKIASYPEFPERNNVALQKVVSYAKERGIKTFFWNKEDGVHYDRFIDSAELFDHIGTVDSTCLERYRTDLGPDKPVSVLMFAVQPKFHCVALEDTRHFVGEASFVGSYSTHLHERRRQWQDMMFEVFAPMGLDIYDRNSDRSSFVYRYPLMPGMRVYPGVKNQKTAHIYRKYRYCLNVNTIENSPTMFSRRLIEIMAVGGVAITTDSQAVQELFSSYCYSFSSREGLLGIIDQTQGGGYLQAQERALAGAEYVHTYHTWCHRLQELEAWSLF